MKLDLGWLVFTALVGGIFALFGMLRRANEWMYLRGLGEMKCSLPPGDMGWPFIGNMWSFLKAFKYGHPDSFISSFDTRFGNTRIYKAFMFGNPSIIVTTPETCRRVLMDDKDFGSGWPMSVTKLMGKKGFHGISKEEHNRMRRLTASPIKGDEALSVYVEYIKDIVMTSLDKWAGMERPIEFLTEMRKIAFKVVMHIILSSEIDSMLETLEREYSILIHGLKAMAINLPGFAYHRALKARKRLVKIFQATVNERRDMTKINQSREKKDMLDLLIEIEDEDGRRLNDEEIIDLIIIYLIAGHESSAHATMWAVLFLQKHPHFFQKAKEEQEEIVRRRPPVESGLSVKEIKQMEYLSKVINETLRLANISFAFFREAKTDVKINGYTIPKGWKVLAWIRSVHMDPEIYQNPKEFDPSRWNDHTTKAGTYIPFGAGHRLCPGLDLAKLEISVFLHYFLLHYKLSSFSFINRWKGLLFFKFGFQKFVYSKNSASPVLAPKRFTSLQFDFIFPFYYPHFDTSKCVIYRLEQLNPGCRERYLPIARPVDNCLAQIKKL